MRTKRLAAIGLTLTIALGACAGGDGGSEEKADTPAGEATTKVAVKDFVFAPKRITVKKGETVTWTNEDEFDHSVQIDSIDLAGPKFGPMTMPVTYAHQFTEAGTYEYLCGVHNSMTGTVVVSD